MGIFHYSMILGILFALSTRGTVPTGSIAPNFSATDSVGKKHLSSQYKGKFVVLEWMNKDCPFVRKHYDSGNMQQLQKTYTSKGVVWLQIVSSAKGKQGFITAEEANALIVKEKSNATALLLDWQGDLGKLFSAKTTPHMFVISPDGKLIYQGAIDDRASTDKEDIPGSTNFVKRALDEALVGKLVTVNSSPSYGCSIKY